MQSPDILDIVPEHVADPVRRAPWRRRLLTACGDGLLSLLLNGAVVGWLIGTGWPLRPMPEPQAVSVELVDRMPGPKTSAPEGSAGADAGPRAPGATAADADTAAPERIAAEAPVAPSPPAPPPQPAAPPLPPAPPPPVAAADPQPEAEPEPAAAPAGTTEAPAAGQVTPPTEPSPQATPASPEHPDNDPTPRLVEAPSAPPPAVTATEATAEPSAAPAADGSEATPAATPAQPPLLAAPEGDDAVPPAAPPPEAPKPLTAEQRRQAETTAKLAALLPFGANIRSDPTQALPADRGQGTSTAYRGRVYANFNKADDVIAAAKAKHLKGQAVVAFTLDDAGGLAHLAIAISSGNPAVDQAALELIRRAAPFPPPPPGAQRSFSPAIALGLDE